MAELPALPHRQVLALCRKAEALPGFDNFERITLRQVAELLSADDPRVEEAVHELREAMHHAFRDGFTETRPEVDLVRRAFALLREGGSDA